MFGKDLNYVMIGHSSKKTYIANYLCGHLHTFAITPLACLIFFAKKLWTSLAMTYPRLICTFSLRWGCVAPPERWPQCGGEKFFMEHGWKPYYDKHMRIRLGTDWYYGSGCCFRDWFMALAVLQHVKSKGLNKCWKIFVRSLTQGCDLFDLCHIFQSVDFVVTGKCIETSRETRVKICRTFAFSLVNTFTARIARYPKLL